MDTKDSVDSNNDKRLTNLEILLTQQDDVVETLSRLVHEQRLQIENMQAQLTMLQDKLTYASGGEIASEQDESPPPHY